MSGVEVVGAVFANASIALQLAEVAVKLHNFWKSVRDAPKSMKDLAQTLRILEGVLKAIHTEEKMLPGPHEALPTYEPLLECQRYFDELRALAERLQVDISRGKIQRTWKSLRVVFEKSHLDEFKSNLESMKSTLILARQTLASMLAAYNATYIANSVATIITQLSNQRADNMKAVRNMENMGSQLEEHIDIVGKTLQSASNNTIPKPLMSALKSTIRSCARETFKESLEKHYSELENIQHGISKARSNHKVEEEENWDGFEPSLPQRVATALSILATNEDDETLVKDEAEKPSECNEQYDHVIIRRQYDTIFGQLHIDVNATFAVRVHTKDAECTSSIRTFQATLSFRPSSWLSRPALWRISTQKTTTNSRNSFQVVPTFSPIVSHKSPVFQACHQGSLVEVKTLLATRQASIHDIDEWGRGLMHMAAKSRDTSLVKYLINEGCIRGLVDHFGNSPLDMIPFFQKSQGGACVAELINNNNIVDLVRLLAEKGDCDPNFEHFENRCGNNLLQNLCKYRRVLDLGELTPIIHYLLTQETFCMAPTPSATLQARNFSPMSDMLYHTEEEATADMSCLVKQHRIDATFVAEFGYSTMQDALMQDHDVAVIRSLIQSGAWLHTKNAECQTPTRIAWWRSSVGQYCLPFALFKSSRPPEDVYEIYEYLLQGGSFAKALEECGIDLWDFARIEAIVLASDDRDEPLQYATHACYHRKCTESSEEPAHFRNDAPLPYRRRSHQFDDS